MNLLCDKVIKVLREGLGEARGIQRFYFGNPDELAAADLPCIFVQPINKTQDQLDDVYDQITADVLVGVCVDPAKYQRKNTNEGTAERFLMEIEGGRATDGSLLQTSISYVMRHHFTLDNTIVFQSHASVWGERDWTGGVAKEIHTYFKLEFTVESNIT